MTSTSAFAPAKINLALHVTGRRDDGYHLLDSLVVFADIGDRLHFALADRVTLKVMGARAAGVPEGPDNLVLQAARLFGPDLGADIVLEKHLPNAAGIGGGSADAAAALQGLASLWDRPLPKMSDIVSLGADLPVCLAGCPTRMGGIGDELAGVPPLPMLWLVLVNPGVAVPTGSVFRGLKTVNNPGLSDPNWHDFPSFIRWLCGQRNDLETPALALAPEIGTVLDRLNTSPGCTLARMSGSGATCFGLFETEPAAREAAHAIGAACPGWWVRAAPVL
ncbi:4-(cytidine 5'-diphospho)-2-C-methyl-D-erythritol kinase [Fontisubflavum oceani]|uniref:4-(cytidine 5'-diphospho)-2-C-methyl-D-erythritol kinase n=1 Tax=Fontisubflavum oceani TaxID=2978973 RepID=UPI0025B57083|nr:4-(cytidine 5'-diphospho)-2-C-methyl-D-erythritol kinase [Fontisubflavum oceani]WJY22802.1 4-(cytidine 5'-diphospho)-2-C-methyl-D-erythritol kinase [Fontisubflavum oceani]